MNNVILITGGSRGIGAAAATLAAARGYRVCINYHHNKAAADAVVEGIQRDGGTGIAVAADVSREADVERLFSSTRTCMPAVGSRIASIDSRRLCRCSAVVFRTKWPMRFCGFVGGSLLYDRVIHPSS
ncbi:SDR family NAD(P)-dependent oxidoreductase [Halomonas korlensis]|uniref:Short chain dehydrogenase n=1 Tax=Halomonas korlensis TaxID=463301 RepID=A0A1I7JKN7_9GAMM|nr:SDR family NAD(P)-dependent oxidoreductase [Halomonas korlensis]SFU85749.1 short chain dehydrogenase [Halomonas korlensis]